MIEFAMTYKLLALAATLPLVDALLLIKKKKVALATSKLGGLKDMGKLLGNDGLILSKEFQLNFKKVLEGVCCVAPTGEGKTTSITLPNLLSNDLPISSLVVADPKGEQYEICKDYQKSIGRAPILFEPLGNSAKYNPLDHCKNFTEIRELATNLLQNGELAIQLATGKSGGSSEWITMAIPLLTAALMENKNISEAVKFLINTPPLMLPETLGMSSNEDTIEQFNIFMSSASSPKTMSCIISTLLTSTQLFTDHDLINSTSKSDFSPTDLREKPIALFIKYDESKGNYLSPFLSVFYSQLINKIMYKEGLPVLFLLDEFQNIGRLSNFAETVAVSRSKNIGFLVILQNLVKLYDIYGKNNTTTILNNLKTKCVLPSLSDYEAMTYISNLCDDKQYEGESITEGRKTHTQVVRKLFTPGEIRRIADDQILIVAHNKLPFLDAQNIYYSKNGEKETIYEKRLREIKKL